MKQIITTERAEIKLWLDDIEKGALEQAKNLANLPFLFKHVAIMPDAHQGYGMPIGGVMCTQGVVIPQAVGVDIGCGMCAICTSLKDIHIDTLRKIIAEIKRQIPVGFNKHKEPQDIALMPGGGVACGVCKVVPKEYNNALRSLGTLGGGNHFIEIQKGSDGYIWIMIHSGSRNLGKQIAEYYNDLAKEHNARWHSSVPKDWDLAFLPLNKQAANYQEQHDKHKLKLAQWPTYPDIGTKYMQEMQFAVDYALANRSVMMDRIQWIISDIIPDTTYGTPINVAHNYAALENHFGHNVVVHRKGATRARLGQLGIIPGSQGTKSYIVDGLGNRDSYNSCSHGAGRVMSRTRAKKELDLATEIKKMDDKGIIHSITNKDNLDEASAAYKDIDEVMANQADLVEVVIELTPLAVVKG